MAYQPASSHIMAGRDQHHRNSWTLLSMTQSAAALSFRNLERVVVIGPSEVEVGAVVWARSLLVSEAALPLIQGKAQ